MKSQRQKLLFPAFFLSALSFCAFFGSYTGYAVFSGENLPGSDLLHFLSLLWHGLYLVGMLQPQRRRKLLALTVGLGCLFRWLYYWSQVGDLLYALMSFPIELFPDALLIAFFLSPKRGKTLRIVTLTVHSLRLAEDIAEILQAYSSHPSPYYGLYLILGLLATILQFAAVFLLVLSLQGKSSGTKQLPYRAETELLTEAERERLFTLCPHCGGSEPYGSTLCSQCGKPIEDRLPEDFSLVDPAVLPPALQQAYGLLEQERWEEAQTLFEQTVNSSLCPAWANLGLLLAQKQYRSPAQLAEKPLRLELEPLWQRAVDAAPAEERKRMVYLRRLCFNLHEKQRLDRKYAEAQALQTSEDVNDRLDAVSAFARIVPHKDAAAQAYQSLLAAREGIYRDAWQAEMLEQFAKAYMLYACIPQWQDAADRLSFCRESIWQRSAALYNVGKGKRRLLTGLCIAALTLAFALYAFL